MEEWLANNNLYLEASLQWLRLRLQKLAPPEYPAPVTTSPLPTEEIPRSTVRSRFSKWRSSGVTPPKQVHLLTEGNPPSLDEQIEEAATQREAAANMDPPPALLILAQRFGLSEFERDTLLLCASLEFDPALASLCAQVQGSQSKTYPTFSLALSALEDGRWDVMSAHRPLRYARFIEISQPGAIPLTSSALRADERIVNYLKGLNTIDDRVAALLQPSGSADDAPLAESQLAVAKAIVEHLHETVAHSFIPVVQLMGADTGCRLAMAQQVSAALNRNLYQMGIETLPSHISEVEMLARLWQRESLLLPVALYIEMETANGVSVDASAALQRFLSRDMGLVFVGVRETPLRLNVSSLTVEVKKPTAEEQCEAWTKLLNAAEPETDSAGTAPMLAGQFNFSFGDIQDAVLMASTASGAGELPGRVWQACRNVTRPRLDSLAEGLEPKATWKDLVLPEEQMALMRQIAGQVRERHKVYEQWGFSQTMNRGFGISALFAGESGTGKTMAAEVIANDLQLNLYRIDLSAVVSKYIGETEKNLRKVFDAAERGGAILFFDEADALFGKRSEVKDSHDRYANIEINYLLQRMEAFSGLAILATNMKTALDSAFMRRLRFVVNFPFPGVKERQQIWEKALPPQTPRRGLDYARLARLNISGGNIHSIALNAAFIAAQNGQTVTMPVVVAAARVEMRKLEKPISDAEFRMIETSS